MTHQLVEEALHVGEGRAAPGKASEGCPDPERFAAVEAAEHGSTTPREERLPVLEAEEQAFGAEDAQRSAAYRARIAELQAELDQRAEGATSPDVTWEDGYMTGWRRARRGEGYVDPNPYLDDTGPRAVSRRTPTALLGEPDASR